MLRNGCLVEFCPDRRVKELKSLAITESGAMARMAGGASNEGMAPGTLPTQAPPYLWATRPNNSNPRRRRSSQLGNAALLFGHRANVGQQQMGPSLATRPDAVHEA